MSKLSSIYTRHFSSNIVILAHMCAVIGIAGVPEAAKEALLGLLTLQHRGQDAAGILSDDSESSSFQEESFYLHKDTGLVHQVFNEKIIEKLKGSRAIGHARYSTVSKSEDKSNVQPFLSRRTFSTSFDIGMAFNGNIINYKQLARMLAEEESCSFSTNSDLEVIEKLFTRKLSQLLKKEESLNITVLEEAFLALQKSIIGSYALVATVLGKALIAFQDPNGIRPLSLGVKDINGKKAYCISSETCVFSILGYELLRDLEAGEIIYIDSDGNLDSRVTSSKENSRPCMFEWVYFAGAESVVKGQGVYNARLNLGKELSKLVKESMKKGEISPDIVVPVPDTARTAATSLAEELRIPYREALIKNRYVQRSFILASQKKREQAVNLKLNLVKTEVFDKKVLLVDDSIVRGTTSFHLIRLLKEMGAKEVYFASTCPPIRYPCYYGIDFPNPEELLATNRTSKDIEKKIGVDKVLYLSQNSLARSIHVNSLCTACLDGNYPTDISTSAEFLSVRTKQRKEKGAKSFDEI